MVEEGSFAEGRGGGEVEEAMSSVAFRPFCSHLFPIYRSSVKDGGGNSQKKKKKSEGSNLLRSRAFFWEDGSGRQREGERG